MNKAVFVKKSTFMTNQNGDEAFPNADLILESNTGAAASMAVEAFDPWKIPNVGVMAHAGGIALGRLIHGRDSYKSNMSAIMALRANAAEATGSVAGTTDEVRAVRDIVRAAAPEGLIIEDQSKSVVA